MQILNREFSYYHKKCVVKDYENAVRSGLDFLRFVAEEYIRLEVYAYQECDGDDFLTYEVEKEMAYTCCEVSKKLILDFVEEIEYNYGNCPALMRLLRS